MSLRRKSMVKRSATKPSQEVADSNCSPVKKRPSTTKRNSQAGTVRFSVGDCAIDAFLNCSEGLQPIPAPDDGDSATQDSTTQKVEEAKQQLGKLECEIISALFPQTGSPESFDSLALRLGMSIKEVREVADNALRGLRGTKGQTPRPSSVWN